MPVNPALADAQWLRYVHIRDSGHLDYVAKANKCDDFYLGQQWSSVDKALLDSQRRPALTINLILSTIANIQGDQIQSRAEVTFKPAHPEGEDNSALLEILYKQLSAINKMDWKESEVFADGAITSRGFFDVRLGFSKNMQGEIEVSVPNPRNVLIDPDGEEYDPDTWKDVYTSKWLSSNDIAVLFNQDDADYLQTNFTNPYAADIDSTQRSFERFGSAGHYPTYSAEAKEVLRNIRVLERQYKKLTKQKHFVDAETGDMRPIPDDWERNRIAEIAAMYNLGVIEKLVERIRWTVTAGQVVLHDEWSPYKHFTVVPYFPFFRRGRTMGLVENLLDPQELLNKVSSQELHIVNTTANSGYIVKQGGLRNMTTEELEQRGAQTGVVLEMDDVKNIEKIQPNQIPTGIERISYKAEEHLQKISAVDQNALGMDREDVAAKAIKAKRQRGSVNQMKVLDNLNYTRWLLARNIIDIIQEYYTEPRIYRITYENPVTQQAEDSEEESPDNRFISVNQYNEATGEILNDLTMGTYDVVVTSMPPKDTIEESEFEQAVALRQLGIAIPDDVIISHSLLREKRAIIKRMQDASKTPEAQAQAALTQQAMENQVALAAAEVDNKKADSMLKMADAQQKTAETMAPAGSEKGANGMDLMSQVMQNRHEAATQDKDQQLRREEMAHEVGTKQMDHVAKVTEDEQKTKNQLKVEGAKAASAVKLAKMKPKPKPAAKKAK